MRQPRCEAPEVVEVIFVDLFGGRTLLRGSPVLASLTEVLGELVPQDVIRIERPCYFSQEPMLRLLLPCEKSQSQITYAIEPLPN